LPPGTNHEIGRLLFSSYPISFWHDCTNLAGVEWHDCTTFPALSGRVAPVCANAVLAGLRLLTQARTQKGGSDKKDRLHRHLFIFSEPSLE
jgi:hypothetical protein